MPHNNHPIWDIIQAGFKSKSADIRLESAECLSEFLLYSSSSSFTVLLCKSLLGLLIRLIGDKKTADV